MNLFQKLSRLFQVPHQPVHLAFPRQPLAQEAQRLVKLKAMSFHRFKWLALLLELFCLFYWWSLVSTQRIDVLSCVCVSVCLSLSLSLSLSVCLCLYLSPPLSYFPYMAASKKYRPSAVPIFTVFLMCELLGASKLIDNFHWSATGFWSKHMSSRADLIHLLC